MKKSTKIPIVNLAESYDRSERYYEGSTYWYVTDLWKHAENFDSFDMPLAGIDASCSRQLADSIYDLAYQIKRVENASLDYPIILTPQGQVADGCHRIAKALSKGLTTIKAIRLSSMPISYKDKS